MYLVMERLVIDPELEFSIDIDRAVELINEHRNVACWSFEEAEEILLKLGMTQASVDILLAKAIANDDATGILKEIEIEVQRGLPR